NCRHNWPSSNAPPFPFFCGPSSGSIVRAHAEPAGCASFVHPTHGLKVESAVVAPMLMILKCAVRPAEAGRMTPAGQWPSLRRSAQADCECAELDVDSAA